MNYLIYKHINFSENFSIISDFERPFFCESPYYPASLISVADWTIKYPRLEPNLDHLAMETIYLLSEAGEFPGDIIYLCFVNKVYPFYIVEDRYEQIY